MVLLVLRRIPTGLKIHARVGDQAHITDIMQDMQITPGQPRQHPEKGQVHHNIRNGFIQGRVTRAEGRAVKVTHQPVQWPPSRQISLYPPLAPETSNVGFVKRREGTSAMDI